jgi:hypothetical protein
LNTVGSFDERFFMYGEDIDLSYRITQAGWKNYYFAGSTIIHFKGESTARHSLRYVRLFYQAMLLFVDKHFQGRGAGAYRLLLRTGIGLRAAGGALARLLPRKPKESTIPATLRLQTIGWPESISLPQAAIIQEQQVALDLQGSGQDALLLVPGYGMPMSAAIRTMEKQAATRACWLHHVRTNSLVCSADKQTAGLSGLFSQP